MATPKKKCLIPSCRSVGVLKIYKRQGILKVIECASQRQDENTLSSFQSVLDSEGDQALLELHVSCYCSYTSKEHIRRLLGKKKRDSISESDGAPAARMRRSQVVDFDFKTNCLFCSGVCEQLNPKHPERWNRVIQCERIGIKTSIPFKDTVLKLCSDRNDSWSREVALRCHGVHDLAAAEAQYHLKCFNDFRKVPVHSVHTPIIDDSALQLLVDEMFSNRESCTWTSLELHDKYVSYGGCLTRRQMFTKLVTFLGDDIVVLNVQGCASIVGFREFVGKIFNLSKLDNTDEEVEDILVRKITSEARSIPSNNLEYNLGDFTHYKTKENTSSTLLRFISKLVSDGKISKAAVSISQSIQYGITNVPNQSTLGLGVKLHHKYGSSDLIKLLNEHGYCVSYDEVLRFRKSAAKYMTDNASTLHQMMGLTQNVGLVYGWYDNFDLSIATPNGRRETHAMATEFQVHTAEGNKLNEICTLKVPRLMTKQYNSVVKSKPIKIMHYTGPKKVIPPAVQTTTGFTYAEICAQKTSLLIAQDKDSNWLNSLNQDNPMEWNGFNNQFARTEGKLHMANMYVFGPLIDAPPSHPDTILTTLTYMQQSLVDMGMKKVHLCMDMQLFAVTKTVCWNQPDAFKNVVVHPGGMHIIQSFIGCIGTLMKGSGLESYVGIAYGGLKGIMNGKSWVKAMRAFRSVAVALLQQHLSSGSKTFDETEIYLEASRMHPTGRHWVDNFLIPTLLLHQFERAEREGDVHLSWLTLKRMLKYFFVAGHVQYARHISQYLLEMRANTGNMVELVCRHHDGYWNAVSADQFGEQTAIRIGKGALKGMTLSAELVSEWINAFPVTCSVSDRLDTIYSSAAEMDSPQRLHKEEMRHRRVLDSNDRNLIITEVGKYPNPLDNIRSHLYNPVSGQIAASDVNVADSILIGDKMERDFIASLPGGFYGTISSPIKTMATGHTKGTKSNIVVDLETIFLRLLMIGQQRKIELSPLFAYELCAVPPSLIDGHGCLRKGNKSSLVKRLAVVEIKPTAPDTVIVDVSQLFYHMVWPHGGSPSDLVASIQSRLKNYKDACKKIVVFDKYSDISAKDHERLRRAGEVVSEYDLTITSHLPRRDVIMKSKSNKRALASVMGTFNLGDNTIMETHQDSIFRHDEADITMVSFVLASAKCGQNVIRVLCDDTDVFILLVYWLFRTDLQCKVQMERWDGTVLDINATCADLGPKCLQLLAMHALSGCDTTSYPYGKGKVSALNTMVSGDFSELANIGEVAATHEELINAAKPYFLALYGQPPGTSLETARFKLFTKKKKSPKVMALPPTKDNFLQHLLRAHLQVMLWKAADCDRPPNETSDLTQFGWGFRDDIPVPTLAKNDPAPPELLDVIRCQCKACGKKCSSLTCGCRKQHLSCTTFCNCNGGEDCLNPFTKEGATVQAPDDSTEESDDTNLNVDEDVDLFEQDEYDEENADEDQNLFEDEWE